MALPRSFRIELGKNIRRAASSSRGCRMHLHASPFMDHSVALALSTLLDPADRCRSRPFIHRARSGNAMKQYIVPARPDLASPPRQPSWPSHFVFWFSEYGMSPHARRSAAHRGYLSGACLARCNGIGRLMPSRLSTVAVLVTRLFQTMFPFSFSPADTLGHFDC